MPLIKASKEYLLKIIEETFGSEHVKLERNDKSGGQSQMYIRKNIKL